MNRDDVIDVLSVVAAATRRTVGEADVKIWQEIIGGDDKQLSLRAVRDHLAECPGVWLEPGHVHQRVRAFVRDQLERESDAEREARQESLTMKAAVEELATTKAIPAAGLKFQRPEVNPLLVRCGWCKSGMNSPCVIPGTSEKLRRFHPSRIEAALGRGVAQETK